MLKINAELTDAIHEVTQRFLEHCTNDDFWGWVGTYGTEDISIVLHDLAEFDNLNESDKIIEILLEIQDSMEEMGITNSIDLNNRLEELKETIGYKQVFVLEMMVKLLIKLTQE
jgi:UDP-N-acetylglucosamine 2-epimerase